MLAVLEGDAGRGALVGAALDGPFGCMRRLLAFPKRKAGQVAARRAEPKEDEADEPRPTMFGSQGASDGLMRSPLPEGEEEIAREEQADEEEERGGDTAEDAAAVEDDAERGGDEHDDEAGERPAR